MSEKRDHGGGLDAAVAKYGGSRNEWLDLSTGINPVPYPVGDIGQDAWTALPDQGAMDRLLAAARAFWNVPDGAEIVAANGASAIIAKVPYLTDHFGATYIPKPTYNEHAAAISASPNWIETHDSDDAPMHIYVHPNNPDGRIWPETRMGGRLLTVIDESFCDVMPERSHIAMAEDQGVLILKSFGKFWGLAGLRLGFAIGAPRTLAPIETVKLPLRKEEVRPLATLSDHLGPWAVAGPALEIGARALEDVEWAKATRARLMVDAARLDRVMTQAGATFVGGTDLFRLYEVSDAEAAQNHLAQGHVWSRIFPYSKTWLRLGLPAPDRWAQLESAVEGLA
ncbi:pyridoxal phosphate-dependent class II aminotransferase [Octadecabacter sp. 1_MG-2023]|uniref:threonine-phosphate decarboxylase n=1 Tax=unclassified Octadecabacter TaxID=196158 RepID=UPI001C09587E|nr:MULTISPECIES: threonine-phosphate decarboxylase [unclassified Octadecabacter]MBU2992581.1 pyridoxal phosphate-dependent class II aminotransferase [Octadecabacter sp. B2R22]MDO6734662.1 pyridoxal phosphate-dependent class II aminotransferase [Octadecabacter sp. 1_MG-2023]